MDDSMWIKIVLAITVICLILSYLTMQNLALIRTDVNKGLQCNEVVDKIYEQCQEEGQANFTTLKGRSTTLTYEHGVCIIK